MLNCKDINGNDICQIVLQDNGTVMGVLCETSGGTGTINEAEPSIYPPATRGTVYQKSQFDVLGVPNQECCERFGYQFQNNTCYWSDTVCEPTPDFTIVMDAQGNEGALFDVDEGETCVLNVEFEYLFEFNCDDLLECKVNKNDGELELIGDLQAQIQEQQDCIDTQEEIIADLEEQIDNAGEASGTTTGAAEEGISDLVNQSESLNEGINQLQEQRNDASSEEEIQSIDAQISIKEAQKSAVDNKKQQEETQLEIYKTEAKSTVEELQAQLTAAQEQLAECTSILNDLQTQLDIVQQELIDDSPRIIDMLRALDVCVTLEKVVPNVGTGGTLYQSANGLETIYEEQLFNIGGLGIDTDSIVEYFSENSNTGFLFNGGDCETAINAVLGELGSNCDVVGENTFDSNWLTHSFTIADEETLSGITNERIKLGIKVKNCECDFAVLIDSIEFNKVCSKVRRQDIVINECPGFELFRECDNKKSWVALDEYEERDFDLDMRITDYEANHHKLVINSKEVDLDINIARAIDTDIWCYLTDNPCLLSGCTSGSTTGTTSGSTSGSTSGTTECNDLTPLLSTPLSGISTTKKFQEVVCSELIDAKANKVMHGYPVLKEVYERYMNDSGLYCETPSAGFDYLKMIKFAGLVGDYWVDLIEQVVPATTLWGSTFVYSNSVFDKQKFTYKRYSLFTCDEPTDFPFSAIGVDMGVDVVKIDTSQPEFEDTPECLIPSGVTEECSGVWNVQISDGSEFVGTVKVIRGDIPPIGTDDPIDAGDPITPSEPINPDSSPNTDTGPIVVIGEETAPSSDTATR